MERASEQIHASNAADRVDAVQGHRIPPLWPHRVVGMSVGKLDEAILAQMENIVVDQPEMERYERIKSELVKRLADSDGTKMRKLLEGEEIGDWMSLQFYRDLKKLATAYSLRRVRSDILEDPPAGRRAVNPSCRDGFQAESRGRAGGQDV